MRRMREFVLALHEIWSCWQDGTRLSFEGEFYTHKLMTPMFTPEPLAHGVPKVFVAAVGEAMTEMCGEVADGLLAHAFTTKRYFEEVTTPALLRGMERSGRKRGEFQVSCPLFVVTGNDDAELTANAVGTRKQIAFYASTPAYRKVLDLHGWGDLQTDLHRLSHAGEWDADGLADRRRDPERVRRGGTRARRRRRRSASAATASSTGSSSASPRRSKMPRSPPSCKR